MAVLTWYIFGAFFLLVLICNGGGVGTIILFLKQLLIAYIAYVLTSAFFSSMDARARTQGDFSGFLTFLGKIAGIAAFIGVLFLFS